MRAQVHWGWHDIDFVLVKVAEAVLVLTLSVP